MPEGSMAVYRGNDMEEDILRLLAVLTGTGRSTLLRKDIFHRQNFKYSTFTLISVGTESVQ